MSRMCEGGLLAVLNLVFALCVCVVCPLSEGSRESASGLLEEMMLIWD